ncbi:MAG: MBL fold metallo-hydrolase [Acidobacteriota bacterium]
MTRSAVSILLRPKGDFDRVLLVERSPKLKFFGGYLAFPGGTIEPQDESLAIQSLPRLEGTLGKDFAVFVAAAARELFEETGVWMGKGSCRPDSSPLRVYRRRMLAGEISFSEILRQRAQSIDALDFTPLCRITTPPFALRRYDTWFLQCELPAGATVEIVPGELDGGEFVSARWALERWREGALLIVPPVLILLEELSRGAGDFVARVQELTASYGRGRLHRAYFTPGVLLAPLKTPTKPPATHTNTYVVGHERLYVVDPSPEEPSEQEKLWELLDELGAEGRTLAGILLTHYHPDHVGALLECQRRYRLPAYAHPDTARLLPGVSFEGSLLHQQELALGRSPDGREGWTLRAYDVPGHAPGHLAYHESRYGALLVGDLLSTVSSVLIDPADGHLATYLRSLRFLETVTDGTVYPGHGPPARDGKEAIRRALAHRREREQRLVAALSRGPRDVDALVAEVYTDVDPRLLGLARRSLLSGLFKLEEEGRVRKEDGLYGLVPFPP